MLKYIIGAVLAVCLLGLWTISSIAEVDSIKTEIMPGSFDSPVVVLELFTSQGCSSCPPADELLGKIRSEEKPGIITLSYHVDYWNYIGWEDPFSRPEYSNRQRAYNIKFGSRSNYTPQLVVNGREHFVGSDSRQVYQKISEYAKLPVENHIGIPQLKKVGEMIEFSYELSGSLKGKMLNVLLVIDERTTSVSRGENRNRKLTNHNIVVKAKRLNPENKSGKSFIEIPALVRDSDSLRLVILLENSNADISGAASSDLL